MAGKVHSPTGVKMLYAQSSHTSIELTQRLSKAPRECTVDHAVDLKVPLSGIHYCNTSYTTRTDFLSCRSSSTVSTLTPTAHFSDGVWPEGAVCRCVVYMDRISQAHKRFIVTDKLHLIWPCQLSFRLQRHHLHLPLYPVP